MDTSSAPGRPRGSSAFSAPLVPVPLVPGITDTRSRSQSQPPQGQRLARGQRGVRASVPGREESTRPRGGAGGPRDPRRPQRPDKDKGCPCPCWWEARGDGEGDVMNDIPAKDRQLAQGDPHPLQ